MGKSSIEWLVGKDGSEGETWNPIRGCSRHSPGCGQGRDGGCYAEVIAARFSDEGAAFHGYARRGPQGGRWTGKVSLLLEKLHEPLRWKAPRLCFVNSASDLFHEALPNEDIAAVFGVIAASPRQTFVILTKREERMERWFEWVAAKPTRLITIPYSPQLICATEAQDRVDMRWTVAKPLEWPLPNVILGVSVENQEYADRRIPALLRTPAAIRTVSIEPLLGPVRHSFRGLDHVIVGGESGPRSRPFDLAWARAIVRQCREDGVRCFVKQLGDRPVDSDYEVGVNAPHDKRSIAAAKRLGTEECPPNLVMLRKKKGGAPAEWPSGDWPRDPFPEVAHV